MTPSPTPPPRKPYRSPKLTVYGDVREITQTTTDMGKAMDAITGGFKTA